VGENQRGAVGFGRKVLGPFPNQSILGLAPGRGEFNGTMRLVSLKRASWFAAREIPACVALPLVALTADHSKLVVANTLGDRAEGCSGFYRLKLLGIAD
jgi:hypothetical protein